MTKKPVSKKKVALGVGIGVATAAVAAAGYYFFGTKKSSEHRKKAAAWVMNLKRDVVTQAKKLKTLDEKAVKAIVAEVSKAYKGMKSIERKDLMVAVKELEQNWKEIQKEVRGSGKKTIQMPKKAVMKKKVTQKKG